MQLKNLRHDFEIPVGQVGVTIRKGFKWATVENDTPLDLWRCEVPHAGDCPTIDSGGIPWCFQQGTGKVFGRWVGRLQDLPARLIELEHEASSRFYTGLLASLQRAYGKITGKDYVTALFYQRTSEQPQAVPAQEAVVGNPPPPYEDAPRSPAPAEAA